MRKLILMLFCFMAFIQGCSTSGDELTMPQNSSEINLPKTSEAYGKAVAQELRNIALSFSEKGIDYTKANISPVIKKQVITELYKDVPTVFQTKSSTASFTFASIVPQANFRALTDRQQKFITKILDEYKASKSDEALFERLKTINNEIYSLPEIEQERVFNLSATLYYGLKEVNKLKKEGLMASTGLSLSMIPRLKSFSEDGDGSGGSSGDCKQTESASAIAVGSEIFINGVKHVVTQSAYAVARALWVVTACLLLSSDSGYDAQGRQYCQNKLKWCLENNPNGWAVPGTGSSPSQSMCYDCFQYCNPGNGYTWDCPRPR